MKKKKSTTKKRSKFSQKVAKIMREGVRENTHKRVSKTNPRRKVGDRQAVAIAYSLKRRGKL